MANRSDGVNKPHYQHNFSITNYMGRNLLDHASRQTGKAALPAKVVAAVVVGCFVLIDFVVNLVTDSVEIGVDGTKALYRLYGRVKRHDQVHKMKELKEFLANHYVFTGRCLRAVGHTLKAEGVFDPASYARHLPSVAEAQLEERIHEMAPNKPWSENWKTYQDLVHECLLLPQKSIVRYHLLLRLFECLKNATRQEKQEYFSNLSFYAFKNPLPPQEGAELAYALIQSGPEGIKAAQTLLQDEKGYAPFLAAQLFRELPKAGASQTVHAAPLAMLIDGLNEADKTAAWDAVLATADKHKQRFPYLAKWLVDQSKIVSPTATAININTYCIPQPQLEIEEQCARIAHDDLKALDQFPGDIKQNDSTPEKVKQQMGAMLATLLEHLAESGKLLATQPERIAEKFQNCLKSPSSAPAFKLSPETSQRLRTALLTALNNDKLPERDNSTALLVKTVLDCCTEPYNQPLAELENLKFKKIEQARRLRLKENGFDFEAAQKLSLAQFLATTPLGGVFVAGIQARLAILLQKPTSSEVNKEIVQFLGLCFVSNMTYGVDAKEIKGFKKSGKSAAASSVLTQDGSPLRHVSFDRLLRIFDSYYNAEVATNQDKLWQKQAKKVSTDSAGASLVTRCLCMVLEHQQSLGAAKPVEVLTFIDKVFRKPEDIRAATDLLTKLQQQINQAGNSPFTEALERWQA